ncbi:hypothetical protein PHJA_000965300, partial [Phtheirospermum japonicum]
FVYPKIHITFYNRLPENPSKPLLVHCKSRDDNLGTHMLTHGQSWEFSFCAVLFLTKFKCDLHWNGLNLIVAYDVNWFHQQCDYASCT